MVTPGEMGLFSVWFGIMSVVAVVVNLRLDVAVTVSRNPDELRAGASLASRLAIPLSATSVLIALALHQHLGQWVPGWTVASALALGVSAWALASITLARACAVMLSDFVGLSIIRMTQAISMAAGQLLGVLTIGGGGGLVWGYVIGGAFCVEIARRRLTPAFAARAKRPDRAARRAFIRHHAHTAKFALPADLVNNVCQQLPIVLLGARFGPDAAGLFALMIRAIDAPIAVFSQSVQDVYKRRALSEFQANGECRRAYLDTLKVLSAVAVLPASALFFAGPMLFGFVFGDGYRASGEMAQILAPMTYLRFFASPLGYTLYIARRPHLQLLWQIGLLVMTLAAFLIPARSADAILSYACGYAALYLVYLVFSYRAASGRPRPRPSAEPLS
ncbi:MAG: oligosaccharide flippase family protein [Burkholderiaceae bacterium]